jgi:ankyrin repeat protein
LHGNTALHYAFAFSARQGGDSASGLLSLLLAAGAQANARNFAGQTPKDVLGSGGSICQDLL